MKANITAADNKKFQSLNFTYGDLGMSKVYLQTNSTLHNKLEMVLKRNGTYADHLD